MDEMTGETVLTVKLTEFELATPGVETVMGATPSVATRLTGYRSGQLGGTDEDGG